jgi:hypothetical protein
VKVNPGLLGAVAIGPLPVAADGNEQGFVIGRLPAQFPGHLPAIHLRQAKIEENHVGRVGPGGLQRGGTIACQANAMPLQFQKHGGADCRVRFVFDDEDVQRGPKFLSRS